MSRRDVQTKVLEKRKQQMRELKESFPDFVETLGFTSNDEHSYMVLFSLLEHSEATNRLTKWLIGLTVLLSVLTIVTILILIGVVPFW